MKNILPIFAILLFAGCGVQKKTISELSDRQQQQYNFFYFEGAKQKILGNYPEAISNFKEALKVYPGSHAAMYQLGGLYYEEENLVEALYWARKAVETNPEYNYWYYGQLGQFYNKSLQFEKSAEVFEHMIREEPDRNTVYIEALNQYLNMRDGKNALRVLDRMDKQFGITEESAIRRKDILFALGRVDEAIMAIKALVKEHPHVMNYRGILAETLVEAGKTEEAIRAYNEVLQMDPDNGYAHLGLAELYRTSDQNKKSFQHLKLAFADVSVPINQKLNMLAPYFLVIRSNNDMLKEAEQLSLVLLKAHPNDALSYLAVSDVYNVAEKWSLSRQYLLRAMEYDMSDFRMWQKLLTLDEQLDSFELMEEDSDKALALFPNQTVLYIYNSYANIAVKDYEKAIRVAKEGLEIAIATDDRVNLLTTMADAYNEMGAYNKSDEAFDEVLELDPGNLLALNNYAYYLALRNEKLDKALKMIRQVINLSPGNPSYLDTYGWVLHQLGRYSEAEVQLKKALEITDSSAEILEHYGKTLIQLNREEEGKSYLRKADQIREKERSVIN